MQMPWNDWHRTGTLQLRNLNNEQMAEIQIAARYRPALKIFLPVAHLDRPLHCGNKYPSLGY